MSSAVILPVVTAGELVRVATSSALPANAREGSVAYVDDTNTVYKRTESSWEVIATGGGGAVDSVNGQTGVVVLDTDDVAEGTTNLYFRDIVGTTDQISVTGGDGSGSSVEIGLADPAYFPSTGVVHAGGGTTELTIGGAAYALDEILFTSSSSSTQLGNFTLDGDSFVNDGDTLLIQTSAITVGDPGVEFTISLQIEDSFSPSTPLTLTTHGSGSLSFAIVIGQLAGGDLVTGWTVTGTDADGAVIATDVTSGTYDRTGNITFSIFAANDDDTSVIAQFLMVGTFLPAPL